MDKKLFRVREEIGDDWKDVWAFWPDDAASDFVEKREAHDCEYPSASNDVQVEVEGQGRFAVGSYLTRVYTAANL